MALRHQSPVHHLRVNSALAFGSMVNATAPDDRIGKDCMQGGQCSIDEP